MMSGILPETNSVLLLKTTCLTEALNFSLSHESAVTNITASFSRESTNSSPSFDKQWEDLLTTSAFVCDMVLLSEDSPDIFRFPREEILPCGQDNLFVFPSFQGTQHTTSLKYQLGLSNCIWDTNMTLIRDLLEDDVENFTPEVSSNTASFQWNKGSESGLISKVLITEVSITFDLIPAQQFLIDSWRDRGNADHGAIDGPAFDGKGVDVEITDHGATDNPVFERDEFVPSCTQGPSPPISFTTTESSKRSTFKRSESSCDIKQSPTNPHLGNRQLQILQDMVQSELDEIDRLIFFVQVITGLLLVFLGWSLLENTIWASRQSGSRSSAGIPSSIEPVNAEKHDDCSRFESLDASPIYMDPDICQSRHYMEKQCNLQQANHINENFNSQQANHTSKNFCNETITQPDVPPNPKPSNTIISMDSYHGTSLLASKERVLKTDVASRTPRNNNRFFIRPVPAKVTPDRWTSSSHYGQMNNNMALKTSSAEIIPEKKMRHISGAFISGLSKDENQLDGVVTAKKIVMGSSPPKLRDESAFISEYWCD